MSRNDKKTGKTGPCRSGRNKKTGGVQKAHRPFCLQLRSACDGQATVDGL